MNASDTVVQAVAPFNLPLWFLVLSNIFSATSIIINIPHLVVIFTAHTTNRYNVTYANNVLIKHLAVVDMILAAIRLPVDSANFAMFLVRHLWVCRLLSVMYHTVQLSRIAVLSISVVDRYIVIATKARYGKSKRITHHMNRLSMPVYIFWLAIFTWLTFYYGIFPNVTMSGFASCMLDVRTSPLIGIFVTTGFMFPVALVFCLYVSGHCIISNRVTDVQLASGQQRQTVRSLKLLSALTLISLVCWLPQLLYALTTAFDMFVLELFWTSQIMVGVNTCVHAPIYYAFSPRYQRSVWQRFSLNKDSLNKKHDGVYSNVSDGQAQSGEG